MARYAMTLSFLGWLDTIFLILHVIICVFLIGIVLIQGGKGASMSATFGMGGSASSAFGAQADTFIIKWTRNMAFGFLVTTLVLTYLSQTAGSLVQSRELKPDAQENAVAPVVEAGTSEVPGGGSSEESTSAAGTGQEAEKASQPDVEE